MGVKLCSDQAYIAKIIEVLIKIKMIQKDGSEQYIDTSSNRIVKIMIKYF